MEESVMEMLGIASFVLTFLIAYVQWNTNEKKRRQDLYLKRVCFRERLLSSYLNLPNKPKGEQYFRIDDLYPFLMKAEWLFNNDMKLVINNLESKELDESDSQLKCLPDDVEKVFSKYLKLEYQPNLWQFLDAVIMFFIPNKVKNIIADKWFYYRQKPNALLDKAKRVFKRR